MLLCRFVLFLLFTSTVSPSYPRICCSVLFPPPGIQRLLSQIRVSPLCLACEFSKTFSRLISETLSGKSASISPAFVKKALSRQCPYIADGCQHDAHEFIVGKLEWGHEIDHLPPAHRRGAEQSAWCGRKECLDDPSR